MLPIATGLVVAAVAAGTVSLTLAGHDSADAQPQTKAAAASGAERQADEQRASRGKPRSTAGAGQAGSTDAKGSDAKGSDAKDGETKGDDGSTGPVTTGNSGTCKAGYVATGTKTASGDAFDPKALTAANPTLPFDTRVRITNPENGKSVEVRINDRGPYFAGGCFDLTSAAYSQIASLSDSTLTVEYQVIS